MLIEPRAYDVELALARGLAQSVLFAQARDRMTIARYVVLERIGAGGMGVVYGAYDPQLGRKVALKLLSSAALVDDEARRRFELEARALARVSDPNVVVVHEVGEVMVEGADADRDSDDRRPTKVPYIAMELVAGVSLRRWLEQPRSWREVLDVARQAARGLRCVHAAGLVHRDVKADNIMLGDDGRVRVMDFGLARHEEGELPSAPAGASDDGRRAEVIGGLTSPGALVGTPAYMAPEQLLAGRVDARSDQFSFCVMVWEALYGQRPFIGRTAGELAEAVTTTSFAPLDRASTRRAPEWIRAILLRGLAADPDKRWPDMATLLRALDRDPTRARRQRARLLAGLALGGVLLGLWQATRWAADAKCQELGAAATQHWHGAMTQARAAVLAVERPWATDTWNRLDAAMTGWSGDWAVARTDACIGARDLDEPAAKTHRDTATCLELQLRRFSAFADTLGRTTSETLDRALPAAARLPRLERCANPGWMTAIVVEAEQVDQVDAIRDRIALADAQGDAGLIKPASVESAAAVDDARSLGAAPLLAEALASAALWARHAGDFATAESLFTEAYVVAAKAGYDDVALTAATALITLLAVDLGRIDAADEWVRAAQVFAGRLGVEHDGGGAAVALALGRLAEARGDYADAQTRMEQALAIREATLGPVSLDVADTLHSLGLVLEIRNAFDESIALQERALAIRKELLGPEHPNVARSLLGLTNAQWGAGDLDAALATSRSALALAERASGADHPMIASFLMSVGSLHLMRAELALAEPYLVRAVATLERVRGPLHAKTGEGLFNLAELYRRTGRWDLAEDGYRRAEAAFKASFEAGHPDFALTTRGLGHVAYLRGDYATASTRYREVLEIFERVHGAEHLEVAGARVDLSNAARNLGAGAEAIEHARRAVEIREQIGGATDPGLAHSMHALASAYLSVDDYENATPILQRAMALHEASLGADSIDLEDFLGDLASIEHAAGRSELALAHHRHALRLIEAELGDMHPRAADHWLDMGQILLEQGHTSDAIEALERVDRLLAQPGDVDPVLKSDLEFAWARALWTRPRDRARARAFARAARETLDVVSGDRYHGRALEIERWLDQRPH